MEVFSLDIVAKYSEHVQNYWILYWTIQCTPAVQ